MLNYSAHMESDALIPSPTSRRMQARIVDAVIDTVAQHGISGTTLALVARSAEVSQGVLIFHFRSKDGLLAATLRSQNASYRQQWMACLAGADPLQQVLGLIRVDFSPTVCSRRALAQWFAFWGETSAQPAYQSLCEEAERDRAEAMVQACRDLVAVRGGPDPELLARSVDSLTDGLWLQMHIHGSRMPRKKALQQAMDHLRLMLPGLAGEI